MTGFLHFIGGIIIATAICWCWHNGQTYKLFNGLIGLFAAGVIAGVLIRW